MSLFVRLTRWAEFMGVQLAAAEVDERACIDDWELCKNLAISRATAKNVTGAKAEAAGDADAAAAKESKDEAYAYRKLVNSLYAATDAKAAVVSRELTRRVGREPREQRASRFSN
jgi:hypothetical protein